MSSTKIVAAAGAFVFDKDDRVFLAKFTKKFNQQWSNPGGKIEFGESPHDGARRELFEESHFQIQTLEYLQHGSFTVNDTHVVYIDFMADCPESYEVKLNAEFSEWGFFAASDLHEMDIDARARENILIAMRMRSKRRLAKMLREHELGLMRKGLSLQAHSPKWSQAYAKLSEELHRCLGNMGDLHWQHIGSTSIQGLLAKPVLDILMEYAGEVELKSVIAKLEQLGFTYKADAIGKAFADQADENRHFFSFYGPDHAIDYVHLHLVPKDYPHARRMLAFREALQKSKSAVERYNALKLKLLMTGLSRRDYTLSKTALVNEIMAAKAPH